MLMMLVRTDATDPKDPLSIRLPKVAKLSRYWCQQLGYSGERVRQLEIQALVWLRHPAHSQELRTLLVRHSQQEYEWAEEMAQNWLRRRARRHG